MSLVQCKTCGGIYEPIQRDGLRYFHACPPLVHVEVTRDGKRQTINLDEVQGTDQLMVRRAGKVIQVSAAALEEGDVRLNDREVVRANKRDENVIVTAFDKTGQPIVTAKAEGDGVTAAPADAVNADGAGLTDGGGNAIVTG